MDRRGSAGVLRAGQKGSHEPGLPHLLPVQARVGTEAARVDHYRKNAANEAHASAVEEHFTGGTQTAFTTLAKKQCCDGQTSLQNDQRRTEFSKNIDKSNLCFPILVMSQCIYPMFSRDVATSSSNQSSRLWLSKRRRLYVVPPTHPIISHLQER